MLLGRAKREVASNIVALLAIRKTMGTSLQRVVVPLLRLLGLPLRRLLEELDPEVLVRDVREVLRPEWI